MKREGRNLAAAARVIIAALLVLLVCLVGLMLVLWLKPTWTVLALALLSAWAVFSLFTLYFFRDPTPVVPTSVEVVVAPAHGVVDCIEETVEPEFMKCRCHRLSILLTIFDVHVQNAPAAGRVAFSRYQRGRFLNALKTDSARFNENLLIGIESSEVQGERIGVRQIAGLLARRVVSWVHLGDQVARGQRLGLIQYGSRCDLYLPIHLQVVVRLGDAVKGGETIVARRRSMTAVSPEE